MKVKCVENKCGNIYDAVAVVERYEALYEGKQEGCKTNVRAVEASASNTLAQQLNDIKNQLQTLNTRQTRRERAINRDNDMCFNTREGGSRKLDTEVSKYHVAMLDCKRECHDL